MEPLELENKIIIIIEPLLIDLIYMSVYKVDDNSLYPHGYGEYFRPDDSWEGKEGEEYYKNKTFSFVHEYIMYKLLKSGIISRNNHAPDYMQADLWATKVAHIIKDSTGVRLYTGEYIHVLNWDVKNILSQIF